MGKAIAVVCWFGFLGSLFGYVTPEILGMAWHGLSYSSDAEFSEISKLSAGCGLFGGLGCGNWVARFFEIKKSWFAVLGHAVFITITSVLLATSASLTLELVIAKTFVEPGAFVFAVFMVSSFIIIVEGIVIFFAVLLSLLGVYYICA